MSSSDFEGWEIKQENETAYNFLPIKERANLEGQTDGKMGKQEWEKNG